MVITTKQERINGCYTRYGTRPLTAMEIKAETKLSNGMYAVSGIVPEDGISIDVYADATKKDLIFMEHGITVTFDIEDEDFYFVFLLAEERLKEMNL